MSWVKRILILVTITSLGLIVANGLKAESVSVAPTYNLKKIELVDQGFTKLLENENFEYSYKKHNGVFQIKDKRNGYVWKTGIDHDYDQYIEKNLEIFLEENPTATNEQILEVAVPFEDQMNNSREGIANSLVTFEIIKPSNIDGTLTQIGTSSKSFKTIERSGKKVVTEDKTKSVDTDVLYQVNNEEGHYLLDVSLYSVDLKVKIHLYFKDEGLNIVINDNEISGDDSNNIGYINVMPFLGAYGGKQLEYNVDSNEWDIQKLKTRNDGYALVPDGSGALIEFNDYNAKLSGYTGDVYGTDLAQAKSEESIVYSNVPVKNPLMPVYGIAYLEQKAGFVGYAKNGDEHMQIVSRPNDSSDSYNLTNYNITFSRFVYNKTYSQVYNQAGNKFTSMLEDRNHFDLNLEFNFLANEDANYVGMAKKYREYLVTNKIISNNNKNSNSNIGIRLDFLMADVKNTLLGTENVVVTTISDVDQILNEVLDMGINNISSGLYGYQDGGVTLGRKSKPDFINAIGSKNAISKVVKSMNEKGVDISLALDYAQIVEEQISLSGNAAKHVNGWYLKVNDNNKTFIEKLYYAKPSKIKEWVISNEKAIRKIAFSSITYEGFTNQLYGDYGKNAVSASEALVIYNKLLNEISNNYKVNALTPNQRLWNNVDRFLQTPMFSSQYLVETKDVPFLQLVLNQKIELYSSYVNFSFYEDKDILKMIDYNTYPSFILTKEPSYNLSSTNLSHFYSTEYQLYSDLIDKVYSKVNDALKNVISKEWNNREIIDELVVNTYSDGTKIIINYTNNDKNYNGIKIKALDYQIIKGGVA
ncbi:MAG: DUF5696 domain-containing protein [Acholeplasma sp.]|nr:DUF5696 domain-containing protein [Acholeplasma sp.]